METDLRFFDDFHPCRAGEAPLGQGSARFLEAVRSRLPGWCSRSLFSTGSLVFPGSAAIPRPGEILRIPPAWPSPRDPAVTAASGSGSPFPA